MSFITATTDAATQTAGLFSRLWAVLPDAETVFTLATAACMAAGISYFF